MKIGMVSLGCPKNLVDSEVMLGLAQQAGHELTREPESAEVLVVNTCAFIDKAKQESVDAILEMAEFKKTGNCKTLVVAGCLAERYRDELKKEIPEIDAVLGTGEVPQILDALERRDSRLGTRDSGLVTGVSRLVTRVSRLPTSSCPSRTPQLTPPSARRPKARAGDPRRAAATVWICRSGLRRTGPVCSSRQS